MTNYAIEWRLMPKFTLFAVLTLFIGLSLFIGLGSFCLSMDVIKEGEITGFLWSQMTFFYSQFIMPILLCVMVSLVVSREEEHKIWAFLRQNNVSLRKKMLAKFLLLLTIASLIQGLYFSIFLSIARLSHFPLSFAAGLVFLKWSLLAIFASASIISCQLFFTTIIRDLSKQIAFAVVASFMTLAFLVIMPPLQYIYPYSQLALALRARDLMDFSTSLLIFFLLVNIVMIIFFLMGTVRNLKLREF